VFSDPSRLVAGIATEFGVRNANGRQWTLPQFEQWLELQLGLPILHDHLPVIDPHGRISTTGTARRFAPVEHPCEGLLALAEIDRTPTGDSVLAELRASLDAWSGRSQWGFSIGAHIVDDMIIPFEISMTSRPAFPMAKILSVGEGAAEDWELLTGQPALAVHQ
jgi:hypothetical protein